MPAPPAAMPAVRFAAVASLLLLAGPVCSGSPQSVRVQGGRVEVRDGGDRITVGPGGVAVESGDGDRLTVGSPPPPDSPAALGEVTGDDAFAETPGVPTWATDPPPGRLVVTGPLETDAQAATRAANALAADVLAEAAGVPAAVVRDARAVRRLTRLSAVEPVTRDTGENTFTVYRARLLLDAEPATLDALRRAHRRAVSDGRAGVAAGAVGALAGLFGAVWGIGRRKLKRG